MTMANDDLAQLKKSFYVWVWLAYGYGWHRLTGVTASVFSSCLSTDAKRA